MSSVLPTGVAHAATRRPTRVAARSGGFGLDATQQPPHAARRAATRVARRSWLPGPVPRLRSSGTRVDQLQQVLQPADKDAVDQSSMPRVRPRSGPQM